MADITFHEEPITTSGALPAIGDIAPAFVLIDKDLNKITLDSFSGKKKVLNIVPSLDTSVCVLSYETFKESLFSDGASDGASGVALITISRDTPFAIKRYESDKTQRENMCAVSDVSRMFGKEYQCTITNGLIAYFLSRAVIVLDENNIVRYTEQVPEITQEPDYNAVSEILKTL